MAEDILVPIFVCGILFIGMPWILLHYITKWRQTSSLTTEDENLLEDLYETARRLEERMLTVERILSAEDPNWTPHHAAPEAQRRATKEGQRHD